jgi:hypothetical protein
MEIKGIKFAVDIKSRYYIRRDGCRDEYIALRGSNALGRGRLDHIYLINADTLGLWFSSSQIRRTAKRLMAQVPGLNIEQLGDAAVLSAPIDSVHQLCKAAGARARPQLSLDRIKRLTEQTRSFQFSKKRKGEEKGQLKFAF